MSFPSFKTSLALLPAFCALPASGATLIFADNFNTEDSPSLDASDQTGRRSGLLAEEVQIRSSRIQHSISGGQLNLLNGNTGRVRFQSSTALPTNVWWDFASGAAGAAILADGGFRVSFDWTPADNTADEWISFSVGVSGQAAGEPNFRVNDGQTDLGILFRNRGATQYFLNGPGSLGGLFDVTQLGTRQVVLEYAFSSFADGSDVVARASVDGQNVVTRTFQWNNNNGELYMELGTLANGTRIDNLAIRTIPEPGSVLLLGTAFGLAALRRRRRA
jgi:hypothetical protein